MKMNILVVSMNEKRLENLTSVVAEIECNFVDATVVKCNDLTEVCNYRSVIFFEDELKIVKSAIIRRLHRMEELKAVSARTFLYRQGHLEEVTLDTLYIRDTDRKIKWIEHFSDESLRYEWTCWLQQYAELMNLTESGVELYNSLAKESTRFNFFAKAKAFIDSMDFDTYNAGHIVTVQKGHTWTCNDDSNQYLNKGQTSVHNENRVREVYEVTDLEILKNYVQCLWYAKLGIVPTDSVGRGAKVERDYLDYLEELRVQSSWY